MRTVLLVLAAMVAGQNGTAIDHLSSRETALIAEISASGRCVSAEESADARVKERPKIAPGAPPLLSFRYYEGAQHHKFGNADLLLDDAGH